MLIPRYAHANHGTVPTRLLAVLQLKFFNTLEPPSVIREEYSASRLTGEVTSLRA